MLEINAVAARLQMHTLDAQSRSTHIRIAAILPVNVIDE
jgi:hypothetical protein